MINRRSLFAALAGALWPWKAQARPFEHYEIRVRKTSCLTMADIQACVDAFERAIAQHEAKSNLSPTQLRQRPQQLGHGDGNGVRAGRIAE